MGFEIVTPGSWQGPAALTPGTCSLTKDGKLLVLAKDLEAARISGRVVVLADAATRRIALRSLRDREGPQSVTAAVVHKGAAAKRRDSGRRAIRVTHALRALGLSGAECAKVSGRYPLQAKGEPGVSTDLLIVNLAGERAGTETKQTKVAAGRNAHPAAGAGPR